MILTYWSVGLYYDTYLYWSVGLYYVPTGVWACTIPGTGQHVVANLGLMGELN